VLLYFTLFYNVEGAAIPLCAKGCGIRALSPFGVENERILCCKKKGNADCKVKYYVRKNQSVTHLSVVRKGSLLATATIHSERRKINRLFFHKLIKGESSLMREVAVRALSRCQVNRSESQASFQVVKSRH